MIIDLILDRKDGTSYSPDRFYRNVMSYSGIFPDIVDPISRAMDFGTETDVKKALCDYVTENEYSPDICDYIQSVNWLVDGPTAAELNIAPAAVDLATDIGRFFDDMDHWGYLDGIDAYFDGNENAAVLNDAGNIDCGNYEYLANWLIENIQDENAGADDRARAAELLARLLKYAARVNA